MASLEESALRSSIELCIDLLSSQQTCTHTSYKEVKKMQSFINRDSLLQVNCLQIV